MTTLSILYTIVGFGYLLYLTIRHLFLLKFKMHHFLGMVVFLPHTLLFCAMGYVGWVIITHERDNL